MGNIIVGLLLLAIVSLIILSLVRNKKKGKHSCSSGCAACAMAGSCHKGKESSQSSKANACSTVLEIDGMMCAMCESHINDAIRNNFSVKSVKSSHKTGITQIESEEPLDGEKLRSVIEATGYRLLSKEVTSQEL
ncbi:MAG: FeoB-associated Cys-rich membrane protein [Treponema sp.]|nr:FeoB-associated Cys-rich membrane protein [Treponema sp.]